MILRQAKSAWPDVADHDRPLGKRGRRDAPLAGRWLQENDRIPDRVLDCPSGQGNLAAGASAQEAAPPVDCDDRLYGAVLDDVLEIAGETVAGSPGCSSSVTSRASAR